MSNKQPQPQEILKLARKKAGLRQEDIAGKIGVSHRMYQRYEAGDFPKYKPESIAALDKFLGTNLCDIIYDKTVPHGTEKRVQVMIEEPENLLYQNQSDYLKAFIEEKEARRQEAVQRAEELKKDRDRFFEMLELSFGKLEGRQQLIYALARVILEMQVAGTTGGDKKKEAVTLDSLDKRIQLLLKKGVEKGDKFSLRS